MEKSRISSNQREISEQMGVQYVALGGRKALGGSSWTPDLVKQSAAGVQDHCHLRRPVRLQLTVQRNGDLLPGTCHLHLASK